MDKRAIQSGVLLSWELADSIGVGQTFSTPVPLSVDHEFRDAALDASTRYTQLYELGLRLSHYNFLLGDYSYFQFGWSADSEVRYAYYPNPYMTGDGQVLEEVSRWRELLSMEGLTHEEFLSLIRSRQIEGRIPLIRYENAPRQYRAFQHPCSHLHVGHHSDNRWPLGRVLTPVAFTLMILKQYYGGAWRMRDDDADPHGNLLESRLIKERADCRIIGEDLFSRAEKGSFHFV